MPPSSRLDLPAESELGTRITSSGKAKPGISSDHQRLCLQRKRCSVNDHLRALEVANTTNDGFFKMCHQVAQVPRLTRQHQSHGMQITATSAKKCQSKSDVTTEQQVCRVMALQHSAGTPINNRSPCSYTRGLKVPTVLDLPTLDLPMFWLSSTYLPRVAGCCQQCQFSQSVSSSWRLKL